MSVSSSGATVDVYGEVCQRLEPFRKTDTPLSLDTDIVRDLNLDSLAVMDLVMELEDRFDLSIPLNDVAEVKTVRDLTETIKRIREGA